MTDDATDYGPDRVPDQAPVPARDEVARQVLATAARLLDVGRVLDRLSRPLTVLAFAGLLLPRIVPTVVATAMPTVVSTGAPTTVFLVALLLAGLAGLGQAYLAARVALDAALFRHQADGTGDLSLMDGALLQLGLLPAHKAGRPMAQRFAGARRLLRWQGALLLAQAATLATAAFG